MRLTAKFLVAFVLTLAVALAFTTSRDLARERALFDRDLRHDSRLVGALVAQQYRAAHDRTEADAALRAVQAVHTGFTVERVAVSALPDAAREAVAKDAMLAVRDEHAGRLDTYLPLEPGAALRVSSSLAAERHYLAQTKRRALGLAGLTLVLATGATSVLGLQLIARPTRALVAKARRVGAGDFSSPLALRQRDELGALAIELDAMTNHLATARTQLVHATQARVTAVEQLRHADRLVTVGKLAAGIAHELGTPLMVIEGRARLIETGDATGDEVADSARIVVEQSRRITRIIRELLDFARRNRGERTSVDVIAVARQALELMAAPARAGGVTLVAPDAAPPVMAAAADAGQLVQVLTNLIGNAIHATPRGGTVAVAVRVEPVAQPPRPDAAPAPHVAIDVRDTGVGMDAATCERVFEPFFTTKPIGAGTGLGLAVVHGIVSDHGGWVDVRSTPGAGATFTVHVPA